MKNLMLVVLILCSSQVLASGGFRLTIDYSLIPPITGGGNDPDDIGKIHPERLASSMTKLELIYLFGEGRGFYTGIGYGTLRTGFELDNILNTDKTYDSVFNPIYLKLGYWIQQKPSIQLRGFLNIGAGNSEFSENGSSLLIKPDGSFYELGISVVKEFQFDDLKLEVFAGGSLWGADLREDTFNGVKFDSSFKSLYVHLGVGIGF